MYDTIYNNLYYATSFNKEKHGNYLNLLLNND